MNFVVYKSVFKSKKKHCIENISKYDFYYYICTVHKRTDCYHESWRE